MVQLLAAGANKETISGSYAETPLHAAARNHSIPTMWLLLTAGAFPSPRNSFGATPLHLALMMGGTDNSNLVRLLIQHKAELNAQDNNGETPLHITVRPRHSADTNSARTLIQAGARCDIPNQKGETAFDNVMQREDTDGEIAIKNLFLQADYLQKHNNDKLPKLLSVVDPQRQ